MWKEDPNCQGGCIFQMEVYCGVGSKYQELDTILDTMVAMFTVEAILLSVKMWGADGQKHEAKWSHYCSLMPVHSFSFHHCSWFPNIVLQGVKQRCHVHYIIKEGSQTTQRRSRDPVWLSHGLALSWCTWANLDNNYCIVCKNSFFVKTSLYWNVS